MASHPPRKKRAIQSFGQFATDSDLEDADPEIDSLVVPDVNDDLDWVQNVPGRPAPYSYTWSLVYTPLAKEPKTGNLTIACAEIGDGLIVMNGQYQELNSKSTPHGLPRKPPVCHVIPWALISLVIKDQESAATRQARPEFLKYACWGDTSNLQPGHNACNAQGAKATVQNHTSGQYKQAETHVDRCRRRYEKQNNTTWYV